MYRSFTSFRMTTLRVDVILLCSDRSQERRAKINEGITQNDWKRHPAKQTPALATLLYVDWRNREDTRHQQVNGPPGALPPECVDHEGTCQHRMNADRWDLESAGCPFKSFCVCLVETNNNWSMYCSLPIKTHQYSQYTSIKSIYINTVNIHQYWK